MYSTTQKRGVTAQRTNPIGNTAQNASNLNRKPSDSRSTTSNNSNGTNFQISAQALMPVMLAMKEENVFYNEQKQKISQQMKKLSDMTQKILQENQQLRSHYQQRSADLQKLVQSFAYNVKQDIGDTTHLTHFYKEHNCIIAKQIEKLMKKLNQNQVTVQKYVQQLHRITLHNSNSNENLRNRQVKNKLVKKNIQNLDKNCKKNKTQQLQQQVCNLLLQNQVMKRKNALTLKFIRQQKNQLNRQRPQFKQKTLMAINSVKGIKSELSTINSDHNLCVTRRDDAASRAEIALTKSQNAYAESEKKARKFKQLQERKKKVDEEIATAKGNIKAYEKEQDKVQSQKNKLIKQIENKKQGLKERQRQFQKKKQNIEDQANKKILSIKQQIRSKQMQLNKTLASELNPQISHSEAVIESLKNQLDIMQSERSQLQSKINQIHNPLRDIMKLQLQLNQLKNNRR